MFQIKDRIGLQLIINNREFPFDRVNSLDFLHISCSVRQAVPQVHFRIMDASKWLTKKQDLLDGVPIQLSIKADEKTTTYNFRLFSFKDTVTPTGVSYEIDGYLDAPLYWLQSSKAAVQGTASKVIEEIAQRCGLKSVVEPTTDTQVWIPQNRKNYQFLEHVADHGYINDTSCMVRGLDLNGTLFYRDVSKKQDTRQTFQQSKYVEGSLMVSDAQTWNRSGFYNATSGYADKIVKPNVDTMLAAMDEKLTVDRDFSKKMMMSSIVHRAVDQARVVFRPFDVGNTHDNYERAAYQNKRIANTFMFGQYILTPEVSKTRLLDTVQFQADEAGGSGVTAYSGAYLVTGRVIYVQGINYFEKFELARQGVNASVPSQE